MFTFVLNFGSYGFMAIGLKGNPVKIWNCSRNCKLLPNIFRHL